MTRRTVVVAPTPRPISDSVRAVAPADPHASQERLVLDELDRVRAVLASEESVVMVIARLGGPRSAPEGVTVRIVSPPVFASLEISPVSFDSAWLRVVVGLRAPIALGVLASRGAAFARDPAVAPDGSITYVAPPARPAGPFDVDTKVTFPREPADLAAAPVDTIVLVRRAPPGYH